MSSMPHGRWFHIAFSLLLLAVSLPSGCSHDIHPADFSGKVPIVRVLIVDNKSIVTLSSSQPPNYRHLNETVDRRMDLAESTPVGLRLTATGWLLGNESLGSGELLVEAATEGSLSVDGRAYRGRFRFVPRLNNQFDVVNDVDVEGYLKGVLPRELFANWADETYKAQAVVARTYAIYEKQTRPSGNDFDLYSDDRSQVYGGLSAETSRAKLAVEETRGVVVAYGPLGQERIFKAYFSSCCGGIGQSAAEAFGDPVFPPLAAQRNGNLCSISPRFTWPTVTITKQELTHRIQHYAQVHNMPERDIALISRIDILSVNAVGRPVLFTITDARNRRYAIVGEELRRAANIDSTPTTKLSSSLFQIDNERTVIRFVNGHGLGHGVGMCQWCSQRRAEIGLNYQAIVLLAYPQSKLVTAY